MADVQSNQKASGRELDRSRTHPPTQRPTTSTRRLFEALLPGATSLPEAPQVWPGRALPATGREGRKRAAGVAVTQRGGPLVDRSSDVAPSTAWHRWRRDGEMVRSSE